MTPPSEAVCSTRRCDGCRQLLSELQPGHVCTVGSLTPRILDLMAPGWYLDLTLPNYSSGPLEETK